MSPGAIASDIGVARSTIYEWRREGDWDGKRKALSDKIERARTEASDEGATRAATVHRILSRAEGLAILAEIALDAKVAPRDRTAAVKAHAEIDGWSVLGAGDDEDGPPKRFVIKRSGANG